MLELKCRFLRDVAQLGSALRSGRRGRWFESSHPDFYLKCRIEDPRFHRRDENPTKILTAKHRSTGVSTY